jgi:hypothetical protein
VTNVFLSSLNFVEDCSVLCLKLVTSWYEIGFLRITVDVRICINKAEENI